MTVSDARATARLGEEAERVLRSNWTGASTVPSPTQYPHQWGWDAAYIAVGWAHLDQRHAAQELESLLRGQWAHGRLPSIVFDPVVPDEAYFPGPAFWRSERMPAAPRGVRTSGITQPPLHARAALEVFAHAPDRDEAVAFLRRVYPRLVAQHEYLRAHRDAGGHGLASIVHPWESGLDDAPVWDEPLAAVELPPGGVRPYRRRDLVHVDAAHRPTDDAYDRFVFLARTYRDRAYDDADLRSWSPFLVEDPAFNAILLWSTHALAEIADVLGEDPGAHVDAAAVLHAGMMSRLWDADARRFQAFDVVAGRRVDRRTVASLVPLLDPALPAAVVRAVVGELESPHFDPGPGGFAVPTNDLLAGDFDARRYWRGPVWVNTNWLVARGLRLHGRHALADALGAGTLDLVARGGFREYFDPRTGEGYGSDQFSWTAALTLDLLT